MDAAPFVALADDKTEYMISYRLIPQRFLGCVGKFISEAAMKKPGSVAEYNELLRIWIDGYYHANGQHAVGWRLTAY